MVFSFGMAAFGRESGIDCPEDETFERAEVVLSVPGDTLCKLALVTVGTHGQCGSSFEHITVSGMEGEFMSLEISLREKCTMAGG